MNVIRRSSVIRQHEPIPFPVGPIKLHFAPQLSLFFRRSVRHHMTTERFIGEDFSPLGDPDTFLHRFACFHFRHGNLPFYDFMNNLSRRPGLSARLILSRFAIRHGRLTPRDRIRFFGTGSFLSGL